MISKVQNMKTEHYTKYTRSRKSQNYYINFVDKKGGGSNGELYYSIT